MAHGDSRLITIVDDDELMRGALQGLVKEAGFEVRLFSSAEEFLASGQPRQLTTVLSPFGQ
jgi:FixJ family two-component response regulator